MARPAKFSVDDLLDGALLAVERYGAAATVAQAAAGAGAPTGSLYHRFSGREHLLAALWVRSVRAFQVGLIATATIDDPRTALLAQARHVPAWCRAHRAEAVALTLFRQERLLQNPPEELAEDIRTLNDDVWALGRRQTEQLYGRRDEHLDALVATAVRQNPYGLVRPHLGSEQGVPPWLDDACVAAAGAILDLGH